LDVIFYTHNKRNNSLKLPTKGTTIPCILKDSTSITSPVLELKTVTRPDYNYGYISDFGRYYYVTEWIYDKGIWSCSLTVDVLTSWRSNILNTTAYVEYSSSSYSNNIIDPRMTSSEEKLYTHWEEPAESAVFNTNGCYILSIISTDANGYNGACAVYALTQSQLSQFSATITAQDFLDGVWEGIKNAFNNPFDAIVSCRWIPFAYSMLSGEEKEIVVVYAEIGVNGKLLTNNFVTSNFGTEIPSRAATKSYTDVAPFVTGVLYLPFVGTVPLDLNAFYPTNYIHMKIVCDVVTGDLVYTLGQSADFFVSTYSGNCATQIPLSNNMVDSLGMIASSGGIIGGLATTVAGIVKKDPGLITKGLGAAGLGTYGTARSAEVHTQTNGAISSRVGAHVQRTIELVLIRNNVPDSAGTERKETIGLPCFRTILLVTLSGYCQCSGASVSAPATDNELALINDYLNSGIYID
jgi:hypothetical protein